MHKESKSSQIDTIVFDLGGVLIDWNPRYLFAKIFSSKDEMEYFLTEVCSPVWNARQDAGRTFKEAIREIELKYPKYKDHAQIYFDRWPETLGSAIDGTVKILRQVKSRGYKVVALSNWAEETFHFAESRFDFLKEFDELFISGRIKMIKPEARFYELVEKKRNAQPSQLIFIDDLSLNTEAAKNRGWSALQFKGPEKLELDLKALAILD